jgi:hypothetical protein
VKTSNLTFHDLVQHRIIGLRLTSVSYSHGCHGSKLCLSIRPLFLRFTFDVISTIIGRPTVRLIPVAHFQAHMCFTCWAVMRTAPRVTLQLLAPACTKGSPYPDTHIAIITRLEAAHVWNLKVSDEGLSRPNQWASGLRPLSGIQSN